MFDVTESILSVRTESWVDYPTVTATETDAEKLCRRGGPRLLEATDTTLTFGWERWAEGHPIRKAHLRGSAHNIAALRHTLGQ